MYIIPIKWMHGMCFAIITNNIPDHHKCIIPVKLDKNMMCLARDTLQTTPTHAYYPHKSQACINLATQARHDKTDLNYKHPAVSVKCHLDIFLWNI